MFTTSKQPSTALTLLGLREFKGWKSFFPPLALRYSCGLKFASTHREYECHGSFRIQKISLNECSVYIFNHFKNQELNSFKSLDFQAHTWLLSVVAIFSRRSGLWKGHSRSSMLACFINPKPVWFVFSIIVQVSAMWLLIWSEVEKFGGNPSSLFLLVCCTKCATGSKTSPELDATTTILASWYSVLRFELCWWTS